MFRKNIKKAIPLHRIFLFTSLEGPTTFKSDSINNMVETLNELEIKTNIILFRNHEANSEPSQNYQNNKKLLDIILSGTQSACFDSAIAHHIYSQMKSKTHSLITKFRGSLEISPNLKLNIWNYTKTNTENLASLKKYSHLVDNPENTVGVGDVKMNKMYWEHDDPQMKPLQEDQVIKGFYYGTQIVPIANDLKVEMKVVDERQLKLLFFTELKKLPRHFMMSGVDIIVPTMNDKNILAFNSLVDALLENKKVGVVRYIMRNNTPPKLAAIFPNKNNKDGMRWFYLSQLPTAEDIREYRFSKLTVANEEQKSAVENLIEEMDLMHFKRQNEVDAYEALRPSETYNPVLQIFNQNLIRRGVHGNTDIIEMSDEIAEDLYPERVTFQQNQEIAKKIKEMFGLNEHEIQEVTARARLYWHQLITVERDEEKVRVNQLEMMNAQKMKVNPHKDEEDYVKKISMIHPVSDFNDMRKNKKHDLVDAAIKQMAEVIEKLIEESVNSSHFPKALECLKELRRGCIDEDETKFFNNFLRNLKKKYKDSNRSGFWRMLIRQGISLISDQENRTSEVTEAEAVQFLEDEEKTLNNGMMIEEEDDDLYGIE